MKVVFLGPDAAAFRHGFDPLVEADVELVSIADDADTPADAAILAAADVLVTTRFTGAMPKPERLRLLQLPAAGYNNIELDAVPAGAFVCNAYGHEVAIAEYVIAAMLNHRIPFADADARLRQGDWHYTSGSPARHGELAGSTLGLVGFGHIGRMLAARARALGVRVLAANRSPIVSPDVEQGFALRDPELYRQCDTLVVSLPAHAETQGLVDAAALGALPPHALVINVGRGPAIDETALYDALANRRIGGAVIDTWYNYPERPGATAMPARLPFHDLSNIVMTPHMSAWTDGLIGRRQATIAENIRLIGAGAEPKNIVRARQ